MKDRILIVSIIKIFLCLLLFFCYFHKIFAEEKVTTHVFVNAAPSEVNPNALEREVETVLSELNSLKSDVQDLHKALAIIWDEPIVGKTKADEQLTPLPYRIHPPKYTPFLQTQHKIIVRFMKDNKTLSLEEANLKSIVFKVDGEEVVTWELLDEDKETEEARIPLERIQKVQTNSRVEIEVRFTHGGKVARNFILHKRCVKYSIGDADVGFWFPVAIFSTNLKSADRGIPFAPTPVTFAYGRKLYFPRSTVYIGPSLMIGLVWDSDDQSPDEPGESAQDIFLSKIAFGLLFDVSGFLYIGPAFVADTRAGRKNPGFVATVGIGPKLLEFLQ